MHGGEWRERGRGKTKANKTRKKNWNPRTRFLSQRLFQRWSSMATKINATCILINNSFVAVRRFHRPMHIRKTTKDEFLQIWELYILRGKTATKEVFMETKACLYVCLQGAVQSQSLRQRSGQSQNEMAALQSLQEDQFLFSSLRQRHNQTSSIPKTKTAQQEEWKTNPWNGQTLPFLIWRPAESPRAEKQQQLFLLERWITTFAEINPSSLCGDNEI